jgi:hypothetical protein
MRTTIEIRDSDLRSAVFEFLKNKYPADLLTSFASNDFQVKMTYRNNEAWRTPTYLRLVVDRESTLT